MVPWIALPDTQLTWENGSFSHEVTMEEFRDTLAMMRAKRAEEVVLWWDAESGQPFDAAQTQYLMEQVYVPQLDTYTVLYGISAAGTPDPEKLRYTLRETDPTDETLLIVNQVRGANRTVALKVVYSNLENAFGQLFLNLECSVDTDDAGDIRGLILVWNGTTWKYITTADDFGPSDPGFGFFAPRNETGGYDDGWYETRRTILIDPAYVIDGKLELQIVLRRPQTSDDFTAHFDLAQVISDGYQASILGEGLALGADYDFSQNIEELDALEFAGDWTEGQPSADFDNDDDVDLDDYTAFMGAYLDP